MPGRLRLYSCVPPPHARAVLISLQPLRPAPKTLGCSNTLAQHSLACRESSLVDAPALALLSLRTPLPHHCLLHNDMSECGAGAAVQACWLRMHAHCLPASMPWCRPAPHTCTLTILRGGFCVVEGLAAAGVAAPCLLPRVAQLIQLALQLRILICLFFRGGAHHLRGAGGPSPTSCQPITAV